MAQWEVSFDGFKHKSKYFQVEAGGNNLHREILEMFMSLNPTYYKGTPYIPTKACIRKANEPEGVKAFNVYIVWSITETTP